ncbi:hypothetical protein K502DRAFT_60268 [Neoconidiobolus thromboides FSU 785]|nr:hypothetical protein K502DRAFT_60268 [Neoconidiobolus thromboides FSU 785]
MNSKCYIFLDRICYLVLFSIIGIWSKVYGQSSWDYLISKTDDFTLVGLGSFIVAIVTFTLACGTLAVVDLLIPKEKTNDIKLQKNKLPTIEDYKGSLPLVLFNFIIVSLLFNFPVLYFLHPSSPFNKADNVSLYSKLPSWPEIIINVILCVICEEVFFYYIHRLFHHPKLYSIVHKKHHQFSAPIGIAAFYMEPSDFALSNLIPGISGPLIFNVHPVSHYCYLFATLISTIVTHGGYEVPYFPWAARHDFHHETHHSTFGVLGLMDWIHGTDAPFQRRLVKNNHTRAYLKE